MRASESALQNTYERGHRFLCDYNLEAGRKMTNATGHAKQCQSPQEKKIDALASHIARLERLLWAVTLFIGWMAAHITGFTIRHTHDWISSSWIRGRQRLPVVAQVAWSRGKRPSSIGTTTTGTNTNGRNMADAREMNMNINMNTPVSDVETAGNTTTWNASVESNANTRAEVTFVTHDDGHGTGSGNDNYYYYDNDDAIPEYDLDKRHSCVVNHTGPTCTVTGDDITDNNNSTNDSNSNNAPKQTPTPRASGGGNKNSM
jgi:hypothetical protein